MLAIELFACTEISNIGSDVVNKFPGEEWTIKVVESDQITVESYGLNLGRS
jgi:hypothetical protein